MTLMQLELIAIVLLAIYCFGEPVGKFIVDSISHLYVVWYGQHYYVRNIRFLQYIFLTTSCEIEKGENIEYYSLFFATTNKIPKKYMKGIVSLFKKLYEAKVIVSQEEDAQSFLPYYNRDMLVDFMKELMTKSELIIEVYNRFPQPLKWLFKKGNEKLERSYESLESQHKAISAIPENIVFCMNFEEDEEYEL